MAKRTKQTTMDLSDLSDEQQKMVSLAKEGKTYLSMPVSEAERLRQYRYCVMSLKIREYYT